MSLTYKGVVLEYSAWHPMPIAPSILYLSSSSFSISLFNVILPRNQVSLTSYSWPALFFGWSLSFLQNLVHVRFSEKLLTTYQSIVFIDHFSCCYIHDVYLSYCNYLLIFLSPLMAATFLFPYSQYLVQSWYCRCFSESFELNSVPATRFIEL